MKIKTWSVHPLDNLVRVALVILFVIGTYNAIIGNADVFDIMLLVLVGHLLLRKQT